MPDALTAHAEAHGHSHGHAHPHRHDTPHALLAGAAAPLTSFGAAPAHDHGGHHDHHHHPYPHARHPLGPVTLPAIQGKLAREELDE